MQTQRVFSFLTNCLMPRSSICVRFSIMLMPYFARYLVSRFFNRLQGKDKQEISQYFPLRSVQKRKMHFLLHLVFAVRQPSHLFLALTYPMHSRQFIPHGAMSDILIPVFKTSGAFFYIIYFSNLYFMKHVPKTRSLQVQDIRLILLLWKE